MACCGDDPDTKQPGPVRDRKCRDVLCLLFFLAFWAGMIIICIIAFSEGDANRLVYGIDSYGFTCGGKETYRNKTLDFSKSKNLYYLNPLDLLSSSSISYAKKVCVPDCPKIKDVCNTSSMPCMQEGQYRCPYYRFAESPLYGQLPGVNDTDALWFDDLANLVSPVSDVKAQKFISDVQGLNIRWINNFMTTYNITPNTSAAGRYYQLKSMMPNTGPCYPVWVESKEIYHRCFPVIPRNWTSSVVQKTASATSFITDDAAGAFKAAFNGLSEKWTRYVADISKGILIIIVAGLIGGVVLSLLWMIILRYLAGVMAWLTIILVNVALIGFTLYCFSLAGLLGNNEFGKAVSSVIPDELDPTSVERSTWKWIAIAAAIVAGIVLLITLLMISRIRVAVACIKVASQAVGAMPSILLFPLLPFILEVGLLIYWISVTAMLYSAGDLTANCRKPSSSSYTFDEFKALNSSSYVPTLSTNSSSSNTTCYTNMTRDDRILSCSSDPNCYLSYDWNNKLKYAFIYHFFGLLWTNQFIVGFACVTIAGAIASFYWSRGDSTLMPALPVLAALKNTTVYHLGSVAFGSFIIAVIQFIRFLLDYLDRKTRELQAQNKCAEWAMCCVKCCMWCLEKIVAFINRNAYIMVAVKGTSYCVSAGRAIALLVQNALRLLAVNFIGDILLFLGKVAIAAACGLIAFGMSELDYYNNAEKNPETYLSSPVLPVALSIITGFVVAEIFFSVYEMAIDTVLLAFCEDCECNGGNPRFAPPLLMEAVGQSPEAAQQPQKPIQG